MQSNTGSYKSFLQELAQQEEICLPRYKTIGAGEPHNLTFFASVEIEAEIFHGDGAKSKKQAEENAAKVAYTALTKCKYSSSTFCIREPIEHYRKGKSWIYTIRPTSLPPFSLTAICLERLVKILLFYSISMFFPFSGKSIYAGNPSTVSAESEGEIVKTERIMESLSIFISEEKFRGLSHSFYLILVPINVIVLLLLF